MQQLKKERRGEGREGKEGNSISTSVSHTHTHSAPPPFCLCVAFTLLLCCYRFCFKEGRGEKREGAPVDEGKERGKQRKQTAPCFSALCYWCPYPTHTRIHACMTHHSKKKKKKPKVETNMPQRGEGKKKKEAERTPDGGAASECNQQTHKTSRAHASHKPPLLLFPFLHPLNIHMQTPSKKKGVERAATQR